ncbi:MAG TPA: hypothetical protein VF787_04085 [Thermoanaerobaculia bacterium]
MRDSELEAEFEFENQSEPFLGPILKGVGGMLGLGEGEGESEWESLGEGFGTHESLGEGPLGESEQEQFLGPILKGLGLGESEYEFEGAQEGEQFFKKFISKALPVLKKVAKVAAPIVGGAVGGPLGSKIGSMAVKLLGESEFEYEFEGEFEYESESEAEFEAVMEGPLTEQQALGELMATAAANALTEMEAEAQIGAATVISLSPHDRQALRHVLANINRGSAVLTRILRRNRSTAPFVRTVPTIVKRTAVTLKKQAAAGRPITKQSAAKAMAKQTRKVLSSPPVCSRAVARNVRATKAVSSRMQKVQREAFGE